MHGEHPANYWMMPIVSPDMLVLLSSKGPAAIVSRMFAEIENMRKCTLDAIKAIESSVDKGDCTQEAALELTWLLLHLINKVSRCNGSIHDALERRNLGDEYRNTLPPPDKDDLPLVPPEFWHGDLPQEPREAVKVVDGMTDRILQCTNMITIAMAQSPVASEGYTQKETLTELKLIWAQLKAATSECFADARRAFEKLCPAKPT